MPNWLIGILVYLAIALMVVPLVMFIASLTRAWSAQRSEEQARRVASFGFVEHAEPVEYDPVADSLGSWRDAIAEMQRRTTT